jgi:gamma-glutamyltranspeptidase/glutathione hydrolase
VTSWSPDARFRFLRAGERLSGPSVSTIPRPIIRGRVGAVACGHPLATSAAIATLRAGGGAMDAAVSAAAALAVVLPDACGLGGDAMLLARAPDGSVTAFNGSGAAPEGLVAPVPTDGAGCAAVPGAVAAWESAHNQFGRIPLATVLEPAITLAREGYPVGERLLGAVEAQRHRLERGASAWSLLDRKLLPGTLFRQPELARALSAIATDGAAAFYTGPLALEVERTVAAEGGSLSTADLAAHRTVERRPVVAEYRDARLWLQPPVSQALLAAMVLGELSRAELAGPDDSVHVAVEAVEAAFSYRDQISSPGAEERLLAISLDIDRDRARRRGGPRAYAHTTAVATADADGTVVSQLVSVFDDFGCASLVREGGFVLNNRLTGFSSDSGSPNAAAPGRKPVHTLSPTLIDDGGGPLALATPGADGQVQILVQVIEAMLGRRITVTEALDAPRWRSIEGGLALEAGFDRAVARSLSDRGHEVSWRPAGDSLFGACAAAGFDAATGTAFAAADPRREAWAAAW